MDSSVQITPVLQGTCHIQGPIDEANYDLWTTKSVNFPVEERSPLVNEKLYTIAESGTCNVCSAPCTSCLHLKRTMPIVESKIEVGHLHNSSGRKEDDSCSFIGDKEPNYNNKEHDDQQHASGETSNLLGSTSSYDSCFENSESKARLRVSITDDASKDVKIPPKESSDEAVKLLLEQTTVTGVTNALECHGDSISCISGVKNANTAVHGHMDSDNKNASSSITSSDNLLARKVGKPVRNEAHNDCHIDEIKETLNDFKRHSTGFEESLQKNSGSSSANAGSYIKSEHSEFYQSKNDNSSHHDSFFKEKNACSQIQAEILKCYRGNKESSLAGELATGSVDGQEDMAFANCEINKESSLTSEPSSEETNACMGTEIGIDSMVPSDDARQCSFMKEPSEKSNSLLETANTRVSKSQHQTTSDSENSAEIEDDVKVCDICGDAGQEELLAICSRCSDGAEHTYCMQIMLDKLPEGDWFCEECQLKEETENLKVDKSEAASKMPEVPCLNEKDQSSGSTFNPKVLTNLETKEINSDSKGATGLQNMQNSTKRHEENLEVTSVTGKKVSETSCGSTGIMSTRKNAVLSRESSLNNLDVKKVKPVNPSPSCRGLSRSSSQPIAHIQASSGSNSSRCQGQTESGRGLLSKAASFNSSKMPKVKQLTESVPLRQKVISSSDSRKEGSVKTITKSASFKSTNLGCTTESANKTQSVDPLWAEDPRGEKQMKERNVTNKKNSSISDRPSISPLQSTSTSTPVPKVDIKFPQHVGKSNKTPDSSDVGTDRGSSNANNLVCKEVKKQSSFSSRTSGSTLSNGLHKSEDQKPYQPVSKENFRASSTAADRPCCNPDLIQQGSTPQAAESSHREDKIKDCTFSSSSRLAASGSSRILRCQRCNETGHTTQFCAVDKLRMSAIRPSAERNLREGSNRNSKSKDVEATNSKTRPLKNIKLPDQSDEISTSSADHNSEVTSKDSPSGSLSCPRMLTSMEGTADGQEVFRSSADFSKAAAVVHVKQKTSYQEETICVPKDGNINTILNISAKLNVKPQMQILPGQASMPAPPLGASIIPKLEFIWQGGFKVLRTGGYSEFCDGLQAHPSTFASPKVLEAATKFPCIIHLEEVPCCISWPSQFQQSGPKEDNIALFFFARDFESYKNHYSKLLENMLKNDLALRRNMDGAELLIFPSNLLPENSQRWNNLFFLWGVFRERKRKGLDDRPTFQKLNRPNLNLEPLDLDFPASIVSGVSSSSKISSHENSNEELSRSERSPKRKKVNSTRSADFQDNSSSGVKDRASNAQEYSFIKPLHQEAVDNKMPLKPTSCSLPVSSSVKNINRTCPESNLQMNSEQSYLGAKDDVSWLNNLSDNSDGREDTKHICHVHASSVQLSHSKDVVSPTYSVSSYCGQGIEMKQKDNFMNSESVLNKDLPENLVEIDHVSSRPNRKRMQSSTMEELSHVSCETILQKEEAGFSLNDEEECKKMKLENGGFASCSSREEILSAKLSSKVHPLSSSFINDSIHGETVPESSRSVERNFFPVDSGTVRGKKTENFIYLSSDDEDSPEPNAPDLKLALGGKKKSLDILPLFPPKVGERSNQDKLPGPAVVDGDDVSASLSLSLAFPALEKEQTAKSVSKTEQLMPEKPCASTSFFFFHGFTDT